MTPASVDLIEGEALAVLRSLPTASFGLVGADPPYCSGGRTAAARARPTGRKYRLSSVAPRPEFPGDARDPRSWASWLALWLAEALRVTEPGGYLLLFADWRQLPAASDALQHGGWTWRGVIPWDKGDGARGQAWGFRCQAEFVLWATHGPAIRQPKGAGFPLPGAYRHTVRYRHDKFHEAGKPTPLATDLLRVARPGSRVLEPFCGSAPFSRAARALGHPATAIDLDPASLAVARHLLDHPPEIAA